MASPTLVDAARSTKVADKPKKWIKAAIKHPGALRQAADGSGETTARFAEDHAGDTGVMGKRARLAKTLMSMNHGASHSMYRKKKD